MYICCFENLSYEYTNTLTHLFTFLESYKPSKDRQDTVRSLVRLAVPIFVPRDDVSAREAAKNVVRGNFAKAISEGNFDEFL